MTSSEIRQSFLDFFKSKQHTIVPSSSLMPDSPNLLFTNAGMNQFVPIFLGQQPCPYKPGRAADTQKCIRAGGKHNDLEDVGLDTYHHTFFEMLGNWSFGDYFKKEAIEWAWELVTEIWKFPKNRLYATVYNPDKSKGDPSEFDQEAWNFWAEKFRAAGLDPAIHIVNGNKKDNFWMMGETGPCGPCSEIHVDLTPAGDTNGALVNHGSAECIEIWNLVFIQFNANPDGTFTPLPAKHVDTGMGFERVTSIMQCTKGFTTFTETISNYETDVFRPIFDKLEKLSGKKYTSTLPKAGTTGDSEQEKIDVAFRVIADHIRTLSFAIADGITPGNGERNYVLRKILRRAVYLGRTLGFTKPFLSELADIVADKFGSVFPEVRSKLHFVKETIRVEEEAFNKTVDRGRQMLKGVIELDRLIWSIAKSTVPAAIRIQEGVAELKRNAISPRDFVSKFQTDAEFPAIEENLYTLRSEFDLLSSQDDQKLYLLAMRISDALLESGLSADNLDEFVADVNEFAQVLKRILNSEGTIRGTTAFTLHDTYGYPLNLTEWVAKEEGLIVDVVGFDELMEQQKSRARAAQKKEVISLSQIETKTPTRFIGYDSTQTRSRVLEVVSIKDKPAVVLDVTPCYAEMGGQVGDAGELKTGGLIWTIENTQKVGNTWVHFLSSDSLPEAGLDVTVGIDTSRRNAIQRHHTVTHLFHWALHEVASKEALQKGSYVGPEKLTFDFNSAPLTPQQIRDIEKLVNERIVENGAVSWTEIPYSEAKNRGDITHLFGEKYGGRVRVVQIGGDREKLNGYSMELCGGTHTRSTGEIGLFRIVAESAIAAGVRRIEAIAGPLAYAQARHDADLLVTLAGKVSSPLNELEKKIENLLAHQKELEKQLKSAQQREAGHTARGLLQRARPGAIPAIIENLGATDGETLQNIADSLKSQFHGAILLAGYTMEAGEEQNTFVGGSVSLVAAVTPDFISKIQAGKLIQTIAPIVGGKGGGRPDNARGGGKDSSKIDEALKKGAELLAAAK